MGLHSIPARLHKDGARPHPWADGIAAEILRGGEARI